MLPVHRGMSRALHAASWILGVSARPVLPFLLLALHALQTHCHPRHHRYRLNPTRLPRPLLLLPCCAFLPSACAWLRLLLLQLPVLAHCLILLLMAIPRSI